MADVTAEMALQHSQETRQIMQDHIRECAETGKENTEALHKIDKALTVASALREQKTEEHARKIKRQNLYIAIAAVVIGAIGLLDVAKEWLN